MEERDHYVLIPDAESSALLVAGSPQGRPRLPVVRGRPGAPGVLEALRRELDLVIPYLRPAHLLRDADGTPVAALHELDAPASMWKPGDDLSWLPLGAAGPSELAGGAGAGVELAAPVTSWLRYQAGARLPENRPPWARPGWLATASAWIAETCDALGLELLGPIEVVAQWPISSVLRLETDGGRLYFKAAFSIFRHEPGVTVALAVDHPELVPETVAIDEAHGWLLMRELPGVPLGDEPAGRWAEGLLAIARVHREWAGREAGLRDLRAPDRTVGALASHLHEVLNAVQLEDALRVRLDAVVPQLEALAEEVDDGPLPETLVHGDLHPWNVMTDGDDVRIFDWSDACHSHPLFDLAMFLPRVDDARARETLRDAYLETWTDLASLDELRALADAAAPLAQVHHAQSYLAILDALEPDDRWYFADVPRELLLGAVEQIEARRIARP